MSEDQQTNAACAMTAPYTADFLNLDSSPNSQFSASSSHEQTQAGMPNPEAILRAIYSWLPSYTTAYPFSTYPQVLMAGPVPVPRTNGPNVLDTATYPQAFPSTFPAFGNMFVPNVNTSISPTSSEESSLSSMSSSLPDTDILAGIIPTMLLKEGDLRGTSAPASLDPGVLAPRPPHHELPILPQSHSRKAIPRKRTRIANACERCRIRKARCFGGDPCHRCSKRGFTCDFVPHKPREHKKSTSEEYQTSDESRKRRDHTQASSLSDVEQSPDLDFSLPLARSQSDAQGYKKSTQAPAPVPVPTHITPDSSPSSSALHAPAATHPASPSALGLELHITENAVHITENIVESSSGSASIIPTISIETPTSCADSSTGFDRNLLPIFDCAPATTVTQFVSGPSHDLSFYSSMLEDHILPFTLLYSLQPDQAQEYDQSLKQSQFQPQIADINGQLETPDCDATMFSF